MYYNRMTGIANKYGADTILSGAELIYMLLVPSAFEFDKEENEGESRNDMSSAELNKNKKIRTMETVVQSVLILILMILVILLMSEIGRLQGTARVINYAGLVRGATQREVKLEITGYQNDELIQYLDDILNGLKYGDGNYNLITLDDTDYNKKLDAQIEYWGNLKKTDSQGA
ncbi:MAG: hypothetical protein ACLRWA_13360 [Lachnospira sp.]